MDKQDGGFITLNKLDTQVIMFLLCNQGKYLYTDYLEFLQNGGKKEISYCYI